MNQKISNWLKKWATILAIIVVVLTSLTLGLFYNSYNASKTLEDCEYEKSLLEDENEELRNDLEECIEENEKLKKIIIFQQIEYDDY